MAEEYGEPLWCVGTGMRNTHLRAVAPTVTNSKLSGNVSPGIEPWAANVFTEQTAKGTFIRKNQSLVSLFKMMDEDREENWKKIVEDKGSVQGLEFLNDWMMSHNQEELRAIKKSEWIDLEQKDRDFWISPKEVYKTFKEVNQLELVRQAGIRQQYIDQSVSLNLAFPNSASPKFINKVHLEAYKQGIKTLYYMRTESVLRGDVASSALSEDCVSCDG